ncbi:MAG TPA: hypothetical protein VM367_17880, partial [Pseudonocardia sp.]|nr:hypothetical protein [Pseudonocardia sp.]
MSGVYRCTGYSYECRNPEELRAEVLTGAGHVPVSEAARTALDIGSMFGEARSGLEAVRGALREARAGAAAEAGLAHLERLGQVAELGQAQGILSHNALVDQGNHVAAVRNRVESLQPVAAPPPTNVSRAVETAFHEYQLAVARAVTGYQDSSNTNYLSLWQPFDPPPAAPVDTSAGPTTGTGLGPAATGVAAAGGTAGGPASAGGPVPAGGAAAPMAGPVPGGSAAAPGAGAAGPVPVVPGSVPAAAGRTTPARPSAARPAARGARSGTPAGPTGPARAGGSAGGPAAPGPGRSTGPVPTWQPGHPWRDRGAAPVGGDGQRGGASTGRGSGGARPTAARPVPARAAAARRPRSRTRAVGAARPGPARAPGGSARCR